MKIPYERIVQWLAGPISILGGWASTQITQHFNLLGTVGVTHNQMAHAIVVGTTFITGALVTYLAHAKWMDNLSKWWDKQIPTLGPLLSSGSSTSLAEAPPVSTLTELSDGQDVPVVDPGPTTAEQDMASADEVATQIQQAPGSPTEPVVHGLAPSTGTPPATT